jgi:hypothetical protein
MYHDLRGTNDALTRHLERLKQWAAEGHEWAESRLNELPPDRSVGSRDPVERASAFDGEVVVEGEEHRSDHEAGAPTRIQFWTPSWERCPRYTRAPERRETVNDYPREEWPEGVVFRPVQVEHQGRVRIIKPPRPLPPPAEARSRTLDPENEKPEELWRGLAQDAGDIKNKSGEVEHYGGRSLAQEAEQWLKENDPYYAKPDPETKEKTSDAWKHLRRGNGLYRPPAENEGSYGVEEDDDGKKVESREPAYVVKRIDGVYDATTTEGRNTPRGQDRGSRWAAAPRLLPEHGRRPLARPVVLPGAPPGPR